MGIGDVFARAWDLWRRDVGWLILAGLVVGVIMAVVLGITFGVIAIAIAGAGAAIGVDAADNSTSALTGLGAGLGIMGVIVGLIGVFLAQVLSLTFYGGMFEMVIGAYRQDRGVVFGDLFSGFRKFGAYAVYALVMFGISLGLQVLNVLPFIGAIIAFVVSIWIAVIWLYVLPLIADQGLGFIDAAGKSNQMVKGAGWWWTFGMVILLGLAVLAAVAVIVLVALGFYQASHAAGILLGVLLFLVFAVLFPPYSICYVSVLYIASGGDLAVAPVAGGPMGALPPPPPAPPAFGTPAAATVPAPGASPAGPDAWKAAADPLAAAPPPVTPPASTSPGDPASSAADVTENTHVTEATPADAPEPPEPPAPPAPPAGDA